MHHNVQPDVSIILISWNTRELLLGCLASIAAACGTFSYNVWVVDNASSDGSAAAVRAHYPDVHLIANPDNRGFAAANNQAITASRGRYVLLLNSDTVAEPNSINQLVKFADTQPAAGVVGPMLIDPDGTFQASFADFPSLRSELLSATGLGGRLVFRNYPSYGLRHSTTVRKVDYVPGACMLVRREAIASVGMMDEGYFMYSEESDWCWRFRRAGWETWYVPAAHIRHYGGQSTRQLRFEMQRSLYRSKVRFFRRHYGPLRAMLLQALFCSISYAKWAVRRVQPSGKAVDRPFGWHELNSVTASCQDQPGYGHA